MPQFNSISANLLIPYVEHYIKGEVGSDKVQVKAIKNIDVSEHGIDSKGIRFISRDKVRLRSKPRVDSEMMDEISLGQIVTVISKRKNWIEVCYQYENELYHG